MDGRWDGQLADDRGFGNWSWGWTLPHKTLRFLMNILNDLSLMPGSRSLESECMARSSFTFHCFTPRSSWLVVVGQLGSWLGGSWLAAGGGFLLFFCVACVGWIWLCGGWSYSRHSWPATPALARGDKKQSFIISMTSSNRELKSLMCTLLKHRLSGFVSSDIGVFTLLHRYINQLCTPADGCRACRWGGLLPSRRMWAFNVWVPPLLWTLPPYCDWGWSSCHFSGAVDGLLRVVVCPFRFWSGVRRQSWLSLLHGGCFL